MRGRIYSLLRKENLSGAVNAVLSMWRKQSRRCNVCLALNAMRGKEGKEGGGRSVWWTRRRITNKRILALCGFACGSYAVCM